MCGILGYISQSPNPDLIKLLIRECSIRGLHATGFSYLDNSGNLESWIHKGPAQEALNLIPEQLFKSKCLIGHFRYSTSSLEHNQPMYDGDTSIIHNGVVSQADPKHWVGTYGLTCQGKNDSELILRAILAKKEPLEYFPDASMAVCQIRGNTLSFYRNGKRPLWYNLEGNSLVVASTRDILKRSGLKENLNIECIPGNKYSQEYSGTLEIRSIVEIKDDWQRKTL